MPYFYLLFHSFIIYITLTARGLFLLGVRQILCSRKVCILILYLRGRNVFKGSSKWVAELGKGPDSPESWLLGLTRDPHKQLHETKLLLSLCVKPLIYTDSEWEPLNTPTNQPSSALFGWKDGVSAVYRASEEGCAAWSQRPLNASGA